jgi:hypothetical protein
MLGRQKCIQPSHLYLTPVTSKVQIATEWLKRYKLRGNDEIPAEMIQAGGNILRSEFH